ncbi:MAG: ADP-dependent NAD(P)H-hydrate dehydratase / NAD(P)H-hydrate epimerase [Gaiellales bacterium]|jgi:NAD(P)H-hydrate epimerase|nr:ADP-dependent NAD(P)H-hydrate dehydratase / NAD(P)H-hydrate epimerase [Gaiellales bacterium]
MRRLWYPEEVRELDSRASSELGLPSIALMENAGAEAARAIRERYGDRARVSVLCGPGNNGGDGFVIARHLHVAGLAVGVCTDAAPASTTADSQTMREAARAFGVRARVPEDADLIVDALFGSGFHGRLEGAPEALVRRVNDLAAPRVALDVPSGVDGATGRVEGVAIDAELTLAFHGRTVGTAIEPGRGCSGQVIELAIGLPVALAGPERAVRMDPSDLALAPRRSSTGSKYDAGGVLVVGGSPGMSGAPALAALAAFRAGAGVVWVCVPESEHAAVAGHAPELMVHAGLEPARVLERAARAGAVIVGPGLGRAEGARELVDALVRGVEAPLVLDADALFALAGRLETLSGRRGATALTPHAGELGRLLERPSDAIADARVAAVSEAAERSGAAVLLKGPDTLVAVPGEPLRIVETSVPQLATAGAGDVLAGTVAALCARGLPPALALAVGAVAHGSAARLAVTEVGSIVASDLLLPLARLLA